MIKNVGSLDKGVRLTIAVVLIALIATGQAEGVLAIILGVVAAIAVVTSLVSVCPLYLPFGLSSRKKQE